MSKVLNIVLSIKEAVFLFHQERGVFNCSNITLVALLFL